MLPLTDGDLIVSTMGPVSFKLTHKLSSCILGLTPLLSKICFYFE